MHLSALRKAEARGKTPTGMAILVKPMVLGREDPQFKLAWSIAIDNAEKNLMSTLQAHLNRVINKSTDNIRTAARQAIQKISTIHDKATTRAEIEQSIREADAERKKRNENREKCKLEAAKNPKAKKKNGHYNW